MFLVNKKTQQKIDFAISILSLVMSFWASVYFTFFFMVSIHNTDIGFNLYNIELIMQENYKVSVDLTDTNIADEVKTKDVIYMDGIKGLISIFFPLILSVFLFGFSLSSVIHLFEKGKK